MTTQTERYVEDDLVVRVRVDRAEVDIAWEGISDSRDPGQKLRPFLQKLSGSLKDKNITVDFRRLKYLNSATVSPIVQFVKEMNSMSQSVRLVYDTEVFWQRTHCRCMRAIAASLDRVEVTDLVGT